MMISLSLFADSRLRPALALVACFGLFCLLTPNLAFARVEMVNGSGMTEGDPGDALGIARGGGGDAVVFYPQPAQRREHSEHGEYHHQERCAP